MVGNKHEPRVQSIADPGLLCPSAWTASVLLLPRVALGWISLQFGWSAMDLTLQPPFDAGWLLALGLTLSGIALVLGFLTGPAAFVAGSLGIAAWEQGSGITASATIALAILLALAWRSAGQIGLDRWLLPFLGLGGYRGALVIGERPRSRPRT